MSVDDEGFIGPQPVYNAPLDVQRRLHKTEKAYDESFTRQQLRREIETLSRSLMTSATISGRGFPEEVHTMLRGLVPTRMQEMTLMDYQVKDAQLVQAIEAAELDNDFERAMELMKLREVPPPGLSWKVQNDFMQAFDALDFSNPDDLQTLRGALQALTDHILEKSDGPIIPGSSVFGADASEHERRAFSQDFYKQSADENGKTFSVNIERIETMREAWVERGLIASVDPIDRSGHPLQWMNNAVSASLEILARQHELTIAAEETLREVHVPFLLDRLREMQDAGLQIPDDRLDAEHIVNVPTIVDVLQRNSDGTLEGRYRSDNAGVQLRELPDGDIESKSHQVLTHEIIHYLSGHTYFDPYSVGGKGNVSNADGIGLRRSTQIHSELDAQRSMNEAYTEALTRWIHSKERPDFSTMTCAEFFVGPDDVPMTAYRREQILASFTLGNMPLSLVTQAYFYDNMAASHDDLAANDSILGILNTSLAEHIEGGWEGMDELNQWLYKDSLWEGDEHSVGNFLSHLASKTSDLHERQGRIDQVAEQSLSPVPSSVLRVGDQSRTL